MHNNTRSYNNSSDQINIDFFDSVILYDHPISPCARRVRISLIEKNIPYKRVIIDLATMEQKKEEYLKINPNGLVPTLQLGTNIIFESNVITEFLDDLFESEALYPNDPWLLAQVKMWQSFELSLARDFRPMMYHRVLGPLKRLKFTRSQVIEEIKKSTTDPAYIDWSTRVYDGLVLSKSEENETQKKLYDRLSYIENKLKGVDYLVGNRFSQADISVFPRIRMYPMIHIPINKTTYPNVTAWIKRLESRPSFSLSMARSDRMIQRFSSSAFFQWLKNNECLPKAKQPIMFRFFANMLKYLPSTELATVETQIKKKFAFIENFNMKRKKLPHIKNFSYDDNSSNSESAGSEKDYAKEASRFNTLNDFNEFTLYEYEESPSSLRVRMLFSLNNLKFNSVSIDLSQNKNFEKEYEKINPNFEIPTLIHKIGTNRENKNTHENQPRIIFDSLLMLEYIDALSGYKYMPKNPLKKAEVRMWNAFDQSMIKEFKPLYYNTIIHKKMRESFSSEKDMLDKISQTTQLEERINFMKKSYNKDILSKDEESLIYHQLKNRLIHINTALLKNKFLVGNDLTLADIIVYSRCIFLEKLNLDINTYTEVASWITRIKQLYVHN